MDLNWRHSGTTNDLLAAAEGESLIVVVGKQGTILNSGDTLQWVPQESGTTQALRGVAYGKGVFVAVGGQEGLSSTIVTSTDGVNWMARDPNTTNTLHAVAWGLERFVAVGANGTILVSDNGTDWSLRPTGFTGTLRAIALGGGSLGYVLVTVGDNGGMFTSLDGLAWTFRHSGSLLDLHCVAGITAYRSDVLAFMAAGEFGTAIGSRDGAQWTALALPTLDTIWAAIGLGRIGNGTIGSFNLGGVDGTFHTSRFGTSWTTPSSGTPQTLRGFASLNGGFLVVGDNGTIRCGPYWRLRQSPTTEVLNSVVHGDHGPVVVGNNGMILSSPDGSNWTIQSSCSSQNFYDVAYGGDLYVGVGDDFTVATSSNGVEWACQNLPAPSGTQSGTLQNIVYANGRFVACGTYTIRVDFQPVPTLWLGWSNDGRQWNQATNFPSGSCKNLAFGNSTFVVHSTQNKMYTTENGEEWVEEVVNFSADALSFGGGQFLALTWPYHPAEPPTQSFALSTNGSQWTLNTVPDFAPTISLAFGDGRFVALDQEAYCFSGDGQQWFGGVFNRFPAGFTPIYDLRKVAYTPNGFIAVGEFGMIFQSQPRIAPPQLAVSRDTGGPALMVAGDPHRSIDVESTTRFNAWTNWMTITPTQSVVRLPLPTATSDQMFYRAVSPATR